MSFDIGSRVQVIKINPFGRGYLKKYYRRIGVISEILLVQPSRRVLDGRIYKVTFPNKGIPQDSRAFLNPQKFISKELKLLDV